MNGWTTTKVFRINRKLVVGRSVEDAIRVFRNYCSPNSVNIESIEMVFGDTMKLEKEAIIAERDDRKAAETIALLTEEVEKLKEQVMVLEERPSPPVVKEGGPGTRCQRTRDTPPDETIRTGRK